MTTLELYAGFIITVQLTLLAALGPPKLRPAPRSRPRHEPILVVGFAAAAADFFIMRDKLERGVDAQRIGVFIRAREPMSGSRCIRF